MLNTYARRLLKDSCKLRTALRQASTRQGSSDSSSSIFDGRYLLLLCPATCVCLCVWQLQRKRWKEDLIQRLKNRKKTEPVPLPKNLSELKDLHLFPIKVRGHYDYTNEVYLGPKSDYPEVATDFQMAAEQRIPGVHVITPFKLSDRDLTILVNRGWMEGSRFKQKELRDKAQVHGEQEIVGIVREDQNTSASFWTLFTNFERPAKQNDCDVYLVRKLDILAKRCGTAPVYLDLQTERKTPDEPRPVSVGTGLRNTHLEYALTWFGLAVFTSWLWYARYRSPKVTGVASYMAQQDVQRRAGKIK